MKIPKPGVHVSCVAVLAVTTHATLPTRTLLLFEFVASNPVPVKIMVCGAFEMSMLVTVGVEVCVHWKLHADELEHNDGTLLTLTVI